jgi:hypothetical protein
MLIDLKNFIAQLEEAVESFEALCKHGQENHNWPAALEEADWFEQFQAHVEMELARR